ncbi:hypothetical protein P856_536 [Candidatus Endolissoclinum faulkneri L5]|uniref:Uncharacterized protein n=1 Tax=Candidatus Endolissoclinum faulkneri L5 TaxID=1401328 RepID=V9TT51_9PROT|nr:mitofilin family membrane protein [Candidatus Endolissoclinum faulkneri]AHC73751.1 hypothetical protein P856_536 [Candidatus Endolissoclinum faulkneri L5]
MEWRSSIYLLVNRLHPRGCLISVSNKDSLAVSSNVVSPTANYNDKCDFDRKNAGLMVTPSQNSASSTKKIKVSHCQTGNDANTSNNTVSDKKAKLSNENQSLSVGFMRLIIIIFIMLAISIGYVSYSEWREKAEQYVSMVDVTSPLALINSIIGFLKPDVSNSSEDIRSQTNKYGSLDSLFDSLAMLKKDFESLQARLVVLETKTNFLPKITAWVNSTKKSIDSLTEQIDAMDSKVQSLFATIATFRYRENSGKDSNLFLPTAWGLSDRLSILERSFLDIKGQKNFGWPLFSSDDFVILQERIKFLQNSFEDRDANLIARLDDIAVAQKELEYKVEEYRNQKKKVGAFLVAIDLLQEANQKGISFATELDELEGAAWDQLKIADAIVFLRNHVDGVPSMADLRYSFPSFAESIIKSASSIGNSNNIVDKVMKRIFSLVTLRRTKTDEYNSLDAIINRAEAAADHGDLLMAANYLDALVGKSAEAAQPWITAVKARFAVDQAVHTLHSQALAVLLGD